MNEGSLEKRGKYHLVAHLFAYLIQTKDLIFGLSLQIVEPRVQLAVALIDVADEIPDEEGDYGLITPHYCSQAMIVLYAYYDSKRGSLHSYLLSLSSFLPILSKTGAQ